MRNQTNAPLEFRPRQKRATPVRRNDIPALPGATFTAGVIGALTMTLFFALCRAFEVTTMNFELLLGSMVTQDLGPGVWLLGLFIHLAVGGIFGMIYGVLFSTAHKTGASRGAALGFVHWIVAGFFMGFTSVAHPLVPEVLFPVGAYALALGGISFLLVLVSHLIYGAIVGGIHQQAVFSYQAATRPETPEEAERARRAA